MSDSTRADGAPGPLRPRQPHDFDAIYQGTPAWDIGRPQPVFLDLANGGGLHGRILDVGCGTGEHALMAANLGFEATGIDAAPTAISLAEKKANERGLTARFLVWNALDLPGLKDQFDTVLDCGLFHIFDDEDRGPFVDSLRAVVPPGGRYHLLCFSDLQPGDWGPRRITKDEIHSSFADGWRIESIEPATIEITINPKGAVAWHATITRT